jgi:CxxC motif-containing protein
MNWTELARLCLCCAVVCHGKINQQKESIMGNTTAPEGPRIREIAPGFYNLRTNFKVLVGILNIGTHMSFLKLSNGKFLVIDTVPLDDEGVIKKEIDELTNNGQDMEAVVACHPFHTLAFRGFYAAYPNVPYYGTPRHLRNIKDIPWVGDVQTVLDKWAPEVQMRIPAGAEFVAPQPESYKYEFFSITN